MVFEDNLLSIIQNEKFSKLWLAATNTKAFRHCVKRSELEEIRIPAVCKDILKAFSEYHKRPKGKRMTLFLAGHLIYGSVCIYREQVQCLYEYAHDLFQVQKIAFSQLTPPSRKRKTNCNGHGKRRKLSIKFNLEVCFESENIEQQLELPPGHMIPPLLHDVDWEMERNEPEMFGPMTQEEYRNFMDLVNVRGEYSTNKIQTSPVSSGSQSSKKRKNNSKKKTSPSNKKINKSKKTLKKEKSFEAIREAISPKQENVLTPMDIDILVSKDTSVPTNNFNADTTSSKFFLDENIDLRVVTPSISHSQRSILPPPVVNTPELDSEVMVPQIPSSFNISSIQAEHIRNSGNLPVSLIGQLAPINSPNEETLLHKSRKRKRFFKTHDNTTTISDENFRKQFNFTDTLRCIYPREDIVSLYEMKMKRVDQLLNNPCRSFSNKLSAKHFGKRRKLEKSDENCILNEIVHNKNIIEDKITSHNNNNQNNLDIVEPYISPIKVEIETRNENETSNTEIMKRFSKQILECSNQAEKLRLNINEESLLLKLIQLWKNDIKPINMKTLCEGMKRKEAAIIFFTIMELQRRKFLKLNKNMQNNEIYHIEMRNDI